MTLQPNDLILNGKYRIDALIGEGAFAQVYRATHLQLQAPRALKILRHDAPGVGSTEFADYAQRFQLEAQLGAKLNNQPHIIQVHDFERDGEMLILVMEYASGGSLADRIDQARQTGQPISIADVIKIALEVADGLAAIHTLDVVHRDLKPSNILFDAQGRAKIADLGLAQVPGGPSMRSRLSQSVPHPGTPAYMSPEQISTYEHLAPASDVYALGTVLFEVLTGRLWRNIKPGTHAKALRAEMPEWLDELLARMLVKDYEARPWDGAAVVETVGAAQEVTRRTIEQEHAVGQERAQRAGQEKARRAAEEETQRDDEYKAKQEAEALRDVQVKAQQEAEEKARRSTAEAQTHFENGIHHRNQKNYDQAIADFTLAIHLNPNVADYYIGRSITYTSVKNFTQAIADVTQAINLHPNQADLHHARSKLYTLSGNSDQAIADLTCAIQIDPDRSDFYLERGDMRFENQQFEHAIADFSRAISLLPNHAQLYEQRGLAYMANKDASSATKDFSKAISLDPKSAWSYFWRGFIALSNKNNPDVNQIESDIATAIKIAPEQKDQMLKHLETLGGALVGEAEFVRQKRQVEAQLYFQRGAEYQKTQDYDAAIAEYSKAIERNPSQIEYYRERGKCYLAKSDLTNGMADYTKVFELDPSEAGNTYYWAGQILFANKNYDEAIAAYTEAVKYSPNSAEYYFSRGVAYYTQKKYALDLVDTTRAIELDPDNGKYYQSRSQTFRALGETKLAEVDERKARELGYTG